MRWTAKRPPRQHRATANVQSENVSDNVPSHLCPQKRKRSDHEGVFISV